MLAAQTRSVQVPVATLRFDLDDTHVSCGCMLRKAPNRGVILGVRFLGRTGKRTRAPQLQAINGRHPSHPQQSIRQVRRLSDHSYRFNKRADPRLLENVE